MWPIPATAPAIMAAAEKTTPEIISKMPRIVIPVGLLFHVPRCSIVLFIGSLCGLPQAVQKMSSDFTSLPQLEQNPNTSLYLKLDKRSSTIKKEIYPKLEEIPKTNCKN